MERVSDSLSNSRWYALDRSYWFADYVPGVSVDEQGEGADGAPLSRPDVYYYEDTTGSMAPEDVAAELVNVMLQSADPEGGWEIAVQSPLDRDGAAGPVRGVSGVLHRRLEDPNRLKSRFDAWAEGIPGIGTDMWVLHPSLHRRHRGPGEQRLVCHYAQRRRVPHAAGRRLGEYVQKPRVQARVHFTRALEAWGWFQGAPLAVDAGAETAEDGSIWYPVTDKPVLHAAGLCDVT